MIEAKRIEVLKLLTQAQKILDEELNRGAQLGSGVSASEFKYMELSVTAVGLALHHLIWPAFWPTVTIDLKKDSSQELADFEARQIEIHNRQKDEG